MLLSLSIQNVVLINRLDLDFNPGFSVLTGETGAGKSILLDSLGLVTGKRAETSLIRQGEEKLAVTAIFDSQKGNKPLQELLAENELESGDEIIIKRVLSRDGKGKIFFNDQLISAKLLKEIGKYLVEIHGQFDNQGLLNPATHLDILDAYGNYEQALCAVKSAYREYKAAINARQEAEENIRRAKDEEENLRHWVKELEQINPQKGEEEELSRRRHELMNAEKIIESLDHAYAALTQGKDITSALRQAQAAVDRANGYVNGRFDELYQTLDRALIEASDAIDQLETASSEVSLDSNEQEKIDGRLFALKDLARKHGVLPDDLPATLLDFKQKLNTIELGEDGIKALRQKEQEKRQIYLETANQLHQLRQQTASRLDSLIMQELPPLKMEKAKFQTQITKQGENSWSEKGFDEVCFTVSTNPNSPQGPINKIASGGELSRFMLALKVNLAESSGVGTMIFDEVDAGIGGATAQAVGERLARLGEKVQVLVVTHSPQVAAKGTQHFKVQKSTKENITTTTVQELSQEERREEIARMLAGETVSSEARAAAQVLLSA